ncbi:MAG: carboxypeptidase regulatory-like domain-containing protein [Candidatus Latescibacterota bacterium]|nr:MAG: carboxypeptidase regulatory-like domain-containing protein [Candidatus Latescibacterota bacterium]
MVSRQDCSNARSVTRWFGLALLAGALVGCGDTTTTVQDPGFSVTATITGRVVSYTREVPIAAATIAIPGTPIRTATDGVGIYVATPLGEGIYDLIVEAEQHATTVARVLVLAEDRTQGQVTLHVTQNVLLFENNSNIEIRVVEGLKGGPAPNAVLDLLWDFPAPFPNQSVEDPSAPTMVATDSLGIARLLGVPASPLVVTIPPYDLSGDGYPEFETTSARTRLSARGNHRLFIELNPASDSISVTNTNLPDASNEEFGDALPFFVFSAPMDTSAANTSVELTDSAANEIPVLSVEWTSPLRLEVLLPVVQLMNGSSYNLKIDVRGQSGGKLERSWGFVWNDASVRIQVVRPGAAPRPSMAEAGRR